MKKKICFLHSHFFTSALRPSEWPTQKLPAIALAGRSNVGKSSLISHCLDEKNLAKVSSKPGKTRRINFFLVDQALFLVDLPGYGYAKASKKEQQEWAYFLDKYVNSSSLQALLLLLDMRRNLTDEDALLLAWAKDRELPLTCVLTKADKLSEKEQRRALVRWEKELEGLPIFSYSIKDGKSRYILQQQINRQWQFIYKKHSKELMSSLLH